MLDPPSVPSFFLVFILIISPISQSPSAATIPVSDVLSYSEPLLAKIRLGAEGDPISQVEVGASFLLGRELSKDYSSAVFWFSLAALQEESGGLYYLGFMREKGFGLEQSYKEAAALYRRASALDYGKAMYRLGRLYRRGEGVVQDDYQAANYYRLASVRGVLEAQANYGAMLANGQGIEADDFNAYRWSSIAAKQGNEDAASNAKVIRSRLPRRDQKRVEQIVVDCEKRNFKYC